MAVTIFKRFVSDYRYVVDKEYDLSEWNDEYLDAMYKIEANYNGDTVLINNKIYFVNCAEKTIKKYRGMEC